MYVSLLKAERRTGKLFNIYYHIRHARRSDNGRNHGSQEEHWGQRVSQRRHYYRNSGGSVRNSLQRLRTTSGIAAMETDTPQNLPKLQAVHNKSSESDDPCPIVTIIEGNTLTKHCKFIASPSEVTLGSLNIITHYIKCEPRDLIVTLFDEKGEKITLSSKKPEWNPQFGLFELDFGGRINRDSVKNFQIDWQDEIVSESLFPNY